MLKDYNDLLKENIDISSLKVIPLDVMALTIELENQPDRQAEYKKASSFCSTVKDNLVKSDIAELLTKRWDKPIEEVKSYINVSTKSDDELLSSIVNTNDLFSSFVDYFTSGSTGLGLKSIDESLDGIKSTDVIGIGAYSGNGKSMLAAKIAAYRLVREKNNVLIFSLEMPDGQFMQSIIQEILHVGKERLKEILKSDKGREMYVSLTNVIGNRLKIDSSGDVNMDSIARKTEALNRNGWHVDFTIVDHFQMLRGVSDYGVFESEAHKMKFYSKKYKCPLLMLSQLNDEFLATGVKFKPPSNKSLKGPNSFVSALDICLLMWRPYLVDNTLSSIEREECKFDTWIKISKSRREMDGPLLFRYKYNKNDYGLHEIPLTE